jgi:hypothetical protein
MGADGVEAVGMGESNARYHDASDSVAPTEVPTDARLASLARQPSAPILRARRSVDEAGNLSWQGAGLPPVPSQVLDYDAGQTTVVVARIRPQTALEIAAGGSNCVYIQDSQDESHQEDELEPLSSSRAAGGAVIVVKGREGMTRDTDYTLHGALGPDSTQEDVFEMVALPVVEGFVYGISGAVLAVSFKS